VLILHRSSRADQLVVALGDVLVEPLADPVAPEVVAVPTRGVERWISQRLSHRLGAPAPGGAGVCANLRFPFPGTLVTQVTAAAAGIDPEDDPWSPDRLVWPLMDVLADRAEDQVLAPLVQHVAATGGAPAPGRGAGDPPARRYAVLRRVADLYDRYAVHRPDMVMDWAAGGDGPAAVAGAHWQPHLWRLVRDAVGVPGPAERLVGAAVRIASAPDLVDLPERLSVFGLTRLPAAHVAVLQALGAGRDVHLFLLHPSGRLWATAAATLDGRPPVLRRADDPTGRLPRHPLLRSWGRDAREMQLVLHGAGAADRHHPVPPPAGGPARLLHRIQEDIRADRPPGSGDPSAELAVTDRSVQVHACHGRARQVEVLRDALLHILDEDPTVEARDVIVMCPDIETYAPLVHAAFAVDPAPPPGGSSPGLRVRLADRSLRQTNPLLAVAALLLDLAGSRVTAPAVLDLAGRPAVGRRFRLDQDDVATIERWVAGTAVRWGLDEAHRQAWSLGRLRDNTWAAGLDRLLLGVAMAEDGGRSFEGTVPYDDMASSQVDLAGRFAELVSRVAAAVGRLSGPRTLPGWVEALLACTAALAEADPDEPWQEDELRATLSEVLADARATSGGEGHLLTLTEARDVLAERLRGRPTRANFRTGDLTVCTLVPMRSVPHRVVALIGLDDGAFPRHPEADGDDLLLADPHVGDRDARGEDRQLLLDALMAATDHLVITYCGRDERTNRTRPPCAPVAELLDVVDATVRAPGGGPARCTVVVHHPLQPFDARNFTPGRLLPGRPWSFDPVFLAGAEAAARAPRSRVPEGPLPPLVEPNVQLENLVGFVQHPVRAFLRRRLSLYLGDWSEELEDRLPLEPGPLERWALGDRLLEAVLSGVDLDRAAAAERRRGFLPPGDLSARVLGEVSAGVSTLAAVVAAAGFPPGPSGAVHVHVELPDGRDLVGAVPHVRDATLVECVYSRLAAKHRLTAWVRLLALAAAQPGAAPCALTVGRGQARGSILSARLSVPDGDTGDVAAWAGHQLGRLVDLYDRAMREPLPMACAASAAWAEAVADRRDPEAVLAAAAAAWNPSGSIPGERDQPEHVFVHGRDADFGLLLAPPPAADEQGQGWADGERHRFGRLALRLWEPLLESESVGRR
jgi:exodeoxyribonuclease V gamma subunit